MKSRATLVVVVVLAILAVLGAWKLARATAPRAVRAASVTARFQPPTILETPRKIERHIERVVVEVPIPILQPRDTEEGGETWTDLEETFGVDFATVSPDSDGLAPGIYPLEVGDSKPSLYGWRHAATLAVAEDGSVRVQLRAAEKTRHGNAWGLWGVTAFYAKGGALLTSEGLTGTVGAGLVQDLARYKQTVLQGYGEAAYDFAQYDFDLEGWRVEAGIRLALRWGRPR